MSARPRVLLCAVLLALVAAAAFVAFRYMPGTRAAAPKAPTAVPVSVAQVVQKSVPVTLHAIGNVEPYTSVAVKARVDGQILSVKYKDGEKKLLVTPETVVVTYEFGKREEVQPGTKIFVSAAKKQPDGTVQTPRITYGRNGQGPAF